MRSHVSTLPHARLQVPNPRGPPPQLQPTPPYIAVLAVQQPAHARKPPEQPCAPAVHGRPPSATPSAAPAAPRPGLGVRPPSASPKPLRGELGRQLLHELPAAARLRRPWPQGWPQLSNPQHELRGCTSPVCYPARTPGTRASARA